MNEEILLAADAVSMQFGGVLALNNISFKVKNHSITAIIGPNGAGKTTLFNCLTGFYKATSGSLRLHNNGTFDIKKNLGEHFALADFLSPKQLTQRMFYKMFGGAHRVARAGIARTFQNIRLFQEMTVLENCLAAQYMHMNRNPIAGILNTKGFAHSERQAVEKAYYWLTCIDLLKDANRLAKELPYGHQRRLEIVRALCTDPIMLCLDEPGAGLNPKESEELCALIAMIRDKHKITILLIEHDMDLIMTISEHIIVLDHGEIIADGTPVQIRHNQAVINAYLGIDYNA